jgi:hypothetical protein
MISAKSWTLWAASLVLVVFVPLGASWLRRAAPPRCALDGQDIVPLYQVRIVDLADQEHICCCIRCAEAWLKRDGRRPLGVYVMDEASGVELDAAAACFVHSPVVTNRVTGNRIHAFADAAHAEEHRATFGGTWLRGVERPLRLDPEHDWIPERIEAE